MTHFLARLVDRARGTAPRVEPIIASRFAPSSSSEIAIENELREMPSQRTPAPSETRTPLQPDAAIKNESEPASAEAAKTRVEVVRETLLVPQFEQPAPPLVVRQAPTERRAMGSETRVIATDKNDAATPRRERAKRGTSPRAQPRSLFPTPRLSPFLNEPRDHAPIVRITIGRIEVQAAPAPAPPARKAAQPPGPTLTLDAYLKQRKEGAR